MRTILKTALVLAGLLLCTFAQAQSTCSFTRVGSIDTVKMECRDYIYGWGSGTVFEKVQMTLFFFSQYSIMPIYVGYVSYGNIGAGAHNDAIVTFQVDFRSKINEFASAHNVKWAKVYVNYNFYDITDTFHTREGASAQGIMVTK